MTTMASQITSLTVVYSTVYSDADQRKHQSSASLAFVWGIHQDRWIPRTKGQLRGKCFHLMTSSWLTKFCDTTPCHKATIGCLTHWPLGKFEWNFRYLIFQIISVIDGWGISCELALRWMSLDLTDDKSTLVQVMAWCRQATSHYLSQWWPRSLLPYGVTWPLWVKLFSRF